MLDKKYIVRFWSYVAVTDADKCWLWTKCSSRYGYFGIGRKRVLTHRLAYELTHGENSAKGLVIRHTCDTPLCCNPKHLISGTNQDNMNDKISRGRARYLRGDECSWRRLNKNQVVEIKKLLSGKIKHAIIAEKYGVHCVTITDINIGRSWRDV